MAVVFSNNAKTTLASNVSTSATSITVADGSVFPALNGSDYTYVTFEDTSGNVEIVKVTALSGNTLTVVRAQDNTSARAFSAGDKCELRLTSAGLNDLTSAGLNEVTTTASVTAAGALMDSEISNIEAIKTLNQSVRTVDSVNFGAVNTTGDIETGSKLIFGSHDSELGNDYLQFNANSHAFIGHNVVGKTLSFKISVAAPLDTTPFTLTQYGMTINGTMATTGSITGGGTIKTGNDTGKIMLGTSNDLQIYHDGNHSHLRNATGDLRIRSDGFKIQNYGANSSYMTGVNGGAVSLYFAGVSKQTTTANGVTVTGILSAAGGSSTNWNAAYGWGNHASAGYLTSYTDTNTTYSIQDGELSQNNFTNADHTKLNGIATGANNYTHPSAHAISFITGLQTALDGKVDDSQVLTNVPANALFTDTVYTLPAGYATESYVGTQISNLVDSSPATLDTLNELAAALGDDPNFATTVSTSIGTKWTQDNTKISQWNTAYGWGNHASAGYVSTTGTQNIDGIKIFTGANVTLDNPVNSWKYIRLQSSGSAKWDIATKENDTSGALQFRVGGGSANTAYVTTAGNYVSDTQGTLWGSSNDGSGSGLDADLLDGVEGSGYVRTTGTQSIGGQKNFNGVVRLTGSEIGNTPLFRMTAGTSSDATIQFGDSDDFDIGKINYANSNNSMSFTTNAGERARITSTGDFLVAKTSSNPSVVGCELDSTGVIYATSDATGYQGINVRNNFSTDSLAGLTTFNGVAKITSTSSTGGGHSIAMDGASSGEYARFTNQKRLGIGVTAPTESLHVLGNIVATGNITAYFSDARLKDFKGTIPNALSKLGQLNGYYYTPNETAQALGVDNNGVEVGVSAQEVEAVLPEIVTKSVVGQDYKTVMYEKLTPLLIEAVKELTQKVAELELRLNEIEK